MQDRGQICRESLSKLIRFGGALARFRQAGERIRNPSRPRAGRAGPEWFGFLILHDGVRSCTVTCARATPTLGRFEADVLSCARVPSGAWSDGARLGGA